jgi:hypothetical protein
MNNILQLKGQFQKRKNQSGFGPLNLPKNTKVTLEHVIRLKNDLLSIERKWTEDRTIKGALISAHYTCIVAKSNRLQSLLCEIGSNHPNNSIRGAKFVDGYNSNGIKVKKHVFTYFISYEALRKTIEYVDKCEKIINEFYPGEVTDGDTKLINQGEYNDRYLSKSRFLRIIVDLYYIERFHVDIVDEKMKHDSIVTIYKTGIDTTELLSKIGIDMINAKMIDETTFRLMPDEIDLLINNAPYLIAMQVLDFSRIEVCEVDIVDEDKIISIPDPVDEPVIGVIDTHFDNNVYFNKWVSYENKMDENISIESKDRFHGTTVSSIIVDGPAFNPNLEDNCGRFRVKLFGVAKANGFSSFTVLKLIRNIVEENRDIKVWNLSLGSMLEIEPNFISPEAAELDRIQCKYDVVFIIAGTNKSLNVTEKKRIGAPADSINSIVVNSVDSSGMPASYTRVGPVLSFFYKPDICYYGGDDFEKIVVCAPLGKAEVSGTSYAAPWITRKVAYLIHKIGFSREVTKALIIDSAADWDRQDNITYAKGYGIVPKNINDIIKSKNDEIRFIMNGTIDEYETYTYNIPVPQNKNAHPFFAKATLAYFPGSDRNQGVDYTSTEMDLHFGRIYEKKGKATIKSIDYNKQAEEGLQKIYEQDARRLYRKWDNVKHISEMLKDKARPRKAYPSGAWGLSIKTKERLVPTAGKGLRFGVVVTLKEMNGVNRIDEFIKLCLVRGWIINSIDIQNRLDIYSTAEEEVSLE